MALNYLEWIKNQNILAENLAKLNEAFETSKIEHVIDLITKVLKNHIDDDLIVMPGFETVTIGSEKYKVKEFLVKVPNKELDGKRTSCLFTLNWKIEDKSSEIYSVSFFTNLSMLFDGEAEAVSTIITNKTPITKVLPLIWDAVNNRDFEFNNTSSNECLYDAYYFKYTILENANNIENINEEETEAGRML